ncbi:MerR family transcriptional regulator [Catenuloplanes indicus JCM 9534]|uniref:DNA-binding transcriptional MerR regulator n=2 Tax=Catenuloplanes indicus TaxID=137267 RepID=A0AAE3W8W1_9ACTN|nr:DNA-binding transcriptional MerR regulator [Catenuloplanes indicus]
MTVSGAAAAFPGPPPGNHRAAQQDGRRLMSIGEVLSELRAEFPDTTISKLRFLEAEGLVEPERTASGYRKYSWDDVARLRFVLTAQRDQYLPLRVIRAQLAEMEAAGSAPVALRLVGAPSEDEPAAEPVDTRCSRTELLERTGLSDTGLSEIERLGLITCRSPGWYDEDALTVAHAVAGLARHGIEARHLRAFRAAADREVGLYAQLIAPLARQRDPAARARAAETALELAGLSQMLHAALLRAGLRDILER